MKKKEDAPKLMYVCLKERIDKKKEKDNTISRDELHFILGVIYCIPRIYRDKVISELIEMKYLEYIRKDKQYYYRVLK